MKLGKSISLGPARSSKLAVCPPCCPEILNSSISWSLQPRLSLSFTFLTSTSFLGRTRSNIELLLHGSSITWSRKLSFNGCTFITYTCIHCFLNYVRNYAFHILTYRCNELKIHSSAAYYSHVLAQSWFNTPTGFHKSDSKFVEPFKLVISFI